MSLVVIACLSGCTVARFGYEMLPWYLMWQLDRLLSLDATQYQLVSERLDLLHAWHRQTQMPRYAELLDAGLSRLDAPLAPAAIGAWRAQIHALWREPAQRIAPDLADLALTLRTEQIDRLERRLAESNADLRRKTLKGAPDEQLEVRVERWQERIQWLLGDLAAAQRAELRRLAVALPSDEAAWLDERQARDERLVQLLRRIERDRPAREQAMIWSADFLAGFWRSDDPARAHRLEANARNGDRVTAALLNTASDGQREHLRAKLGGLERDALRVSRRATRS